MTRRVRPLIDIGGRLLSVEKPARYLGGEFGSIRKEGENFLDIALCFPDLYEIGMSNNAIRILYGELNRLQNVRCERVFAPAPDLEALLQKLNLPLYTLETGIPLQDTDILGFSIGYELAATSILAVLQSGMVPLLAEERTEADPIVLAGGPAISNPHPFADFLDAAYIGEAEGSFFTLAGELAELKAAGARRSDLLARLAQDAAVWMPRRGGWGGKRAVRAVFGGFPKVVYHTALPVASLKTVQDHGTVEIMRGCPNGCRFCHAGYYYRPQRLKPYSVIRAEVESLVREGGYREITLASLSSGDYHGVQELLSALNAEWAPRNVSFQLPSLKVNSFTLPLIAQLAEVRKSGLTFAVETPVDEWQRCINKDVSFDHTIAILEEARARGFKQAKFYFMLGLPVDGTGEGEAQAIIAFFDRLYSRMNLNINANIGTFVPKPHTPFQWSPLLREEESLVAISRVRSELRRHRNLKVSYHSPFLSLVEGIISRGDERVGGLILAAFRRGARLDAWEDHFDRELWRSVITGAGWDVIDESCRRRDPAESLPWDDISVRISKTTFLREYERALQAELTPGCTENCEQPCGACADDVRLVSNSEHVNAVVTPSLSSQKKAVAGRMLFRFSKKGVARFYQHLSIVDAFSRAFLMVDMPVAFSEGFNPMPRLETGQPLPIAVGSSGEIASILMVEEVAAFDFLRLLNARLPEGLVIEEARWYPLRQGMKHHSIGSIAWGSDFRIALPADAPDGSFFTRLDTVLERRAIPGATLYAAEGGTAIMRLPEATSKEHNFTRILEACFDARPVQSVLDIIRVEHLADIGQGPVSFFDAYDVLGKNEAQSTQS